ncbi:hypothetical protein ANRL1_00009 [Anaerolineae bacterium]|nr:hypothetical protein ANRL1_00009 [Anaerolineae bacterium]
MKTQVVFSLFVLTVIAAIVGCAAPTVAPTGAPPTSAPAARASQPTSAAMATSAPLPAATAATAPSGGPRAPAMVPDPRRKIIKNANFDLTVESADTAVDRLTGVTVDMGGYITSSRTFFEAGLKAATVTFAVPVDRFEEALRRVRGIAVKVEQESASGQDVTDQYVDLESQLRNLEATADRVRDFLKKAATVEEALKVNQQLSQVEKEIETIKGKLNYLGDRSAFSTITVEVREARPTPTPTPTSTPTPTPTPVGWHPDQTLQKAVDTQTTLLRVITDLVIWLTVVLLPYAIVGLLGFWFFARVMRWLTARTSGGTRVPPKSE